MEGDSEMGKERGKVREGRDGETERGWRSERVKEGAGKGRSEGKSESGRRGGE